MKPDFIKNFSQRMVFDLIVSALVTVLVVTLTDGILTFFGNGLMNIGYRSAWIGPGGLRPSVRTMILTAAALLSFCLTFYFLMRETIRYIGKILEKVKEISAGDFDHPIEVKGNDEFSVMAENLNTMQQNIKEIMERERIAEHTKNDLVSSVAHDLRTPLTSIIGYLGWVRTRTDLDEEMRNHYIDIAYQKALRLEQLTNELFGFVKLEHKEMQLHLGKLDLVQLMEIYAPLKEGIAQAGALARNNASWEALRQLSVTASILESFGLNGQVRLDFSLVNSMDYYNGVIFQGFLPKIPFPVLSGGRYDNLPRKMGKEVGAIGFALYMGRLEQFFGQERQYDADVLLTYGPDADLVKLAAFAERLRQEGRSVRCERETGQPCPVRCRKKVRYTDGIGPEEVLA